MATFADHFNQFYSEFNKEANSTHVRGIAFDMIYQRYPALGAYYFDWEKNYDPFPILDRMKENNYVIPFVFVVGYMLFCYFGVIVMKDRKAFGLNNSLAAWNLFLAVFSAMGSMRTVPQMLYALTHSHFEDTCCQFVYSTYGGGASGLWTQLFILSKIPELVDTVFIVLRKKPLIFLHWYHHVTVLLFCWNAYVDESSNGLYFVSMNYTVHAVMYFYYFLQSIKKIPKWFPSWIITIMQISQMIIGTFIVGATTYYYFYGGSKYPAGTCHMSLTSLYTGFVIYASYLYLFVEFAVKRFIFGVKEEGGAKKKVKKQE